MFTKHLTPTSVALIFGALSLPAQSQITVDIFNDGLNVSVVLNGNVDLRGLHLASTYSSSRASNSLLPFLAAPDTHTILSPGQSPSFGSSGYAPFAYSGASSSILSLGSSFHFIPELSAIPLVIIGESGTVIVADELNKNQFPTGLTYTATAPNTTLTALGFIPERTSSTSWTTPSGTTESISFTTGSASVPEPTSALLCALGGFSLIRRRR